MKDKKHIDRLFQEHLKDLDVTPNPEVWKGIEAQLKAQHKPKRVIPIWWRTAGVAALLLLFVALGLFMYNPNTTIAPNPSTIVDTPVPNHLPNQDTSTTKSEHNIKSNPLAPSKNPTPAIVDTEHIAPATQHNPNSVQQSNSTQPQSPLNATATVANKSDTPATREVSSSTQAVVNQEHTASKVTTPQSESQSMPIESDKQTNQTSIANNSNTVPEITQETALDTLSIESAIAASKTIISPENKTKKWDVQPNIAPVYYSSIGTGSHLDSQFANNQKSGEINTSYGVTVGYAITDKLKIRSGINNLNLSFNTHDALLINTPQAVAHSNIPNLQYVARTNHAQELSIISSSKVPETQNSIQSFSSNETNSINQNISYLEVPLELEYGLLNSRFGINLIGGFSTFILEDNSIYSEGTNTRTFIGEATNINDLSFSGNLGIGFDYNFSKRFNINLEPTFKYQFNAYNNTSGDFKPYIIGLYTGFSFKF